MTSTRRTTIMADPDLLERVDRLARRERTTKTAVITAALEAWLDVHERPATLPFVGIGRSSHGRLSLDGRSIARREMGRRETEPGPVRAVRPPAARG
ncbi:MAG: CopG family ribbon-helix-helix protein [Candidatus Limnocylindrales bacterium]